ncbi:MAG: putative rane protein [Jatrophihabitans sp.]|nr:putative rane protein [Jatrophihabitans sp.]
MIVLGVVLLIIGFVAGVNIIWTLGIIAIVVGAILAIVGMGGREIAGRRHWY